MVKGISRQVIVIDTPEPKLFEQAIFILKDDMESVTDEVLLKEAQQILHSRDKNNRKRQIWLYGTFWAAAGALVTAGVWALTLWI